MIQNTRNVKIKMFAKTLFAFAFALCLFKPLTADAATLAKDYEYTYKNLFDEEWFDCIFDAARYAAENPDVVAVIGNDPAALFNHYITTGHFEGRKGYALTEGGASINFAIIPDTGSTFYMRVIEFIDTHITDDMTQLQKFQIVWDYLLDENNRADMSVTFSDRNEITTFWTCLNALGIEHKSIGETWDSPQQRVWLDGIAYDVNVVWAE